MARRSLRELKIALDRASAPDEALLRELEADTRIGAQALLAVARDRARGQAGAAQPEIMLEFEREAARQGFRQVAGVDEAGRGPLAGPIVAAAVILAHPVTGINDSKQLTWTQREAFFELLLQGGHAIAHAVIPAEEIDRRGIQAANYQAMAQAAAALRPVPDFLLIDGFQVPGVAQPQRRIVKGDSLSQSIAAASVIAKVIRDRLMVEYDETYPEYGFARHKGYGTRAHLDAIARYGPCPIHRRSFAPLSQPRETRPLFDESGS